MQLAVQNIIGSYTRGSLRKNSTMLMLAQLASTATGFLFWIECARLFTPHDIGLATAIVSYASLVATFTTLGLPNTLVRFLPSSDRRRALALSAGIMVVVASLLAVVIAVAGVRHLIPGLTVIQSSAAMIAMFAAIVVGTGLNSLVDSILLAFRRGKAILGKAAVVSALRLAAPILVVSLAALGIVGIHAMVLVCGILFGIYQLGAKRPTFAHIRFNAESLLAHRAYAMSNYIGGALGVLPSTIVPILVLQPPWRDRCRLLLYADANCVFHEYSG